MKQGLTVQNVIMTITILLYRQSSISLTVILVSKLVSIIFIFSPEYQLLYYTEYPHPPQVQKAVKKSNENNATVILEWIQDIGVSYNVNVTPNPLESSSNRNKSELVVLYNTSYHINIVAKLCGNNMNRTAIDISVDQPGVFV